MIEDALVVAWKESRELMQQRATRVSFGILVAIMGVALPSQEGAAYLQSAMPLLLAAFVPIGLIIATIADSFAGERERHTLESLLATRLSDEAILLGKLGSAVAYGFAGTLLQLLIALVTVNVVAPGAGFYRLDVLAGALAAGVLVATLVSSVGVLVSLRAATVRQAQQILAFSVAGTIMLFTLGSKLLPDAWLARLARFVATHPAWQVGLAGLGLLAALDLVILAACRARFRRARLVLD